jgi:hypothetical protein
MFHARAPKWCGVGYGLEKEAERAVMSTCEIKVKAPSKVMLNN